MKLTKYLFLFLFLFYLSGALFSQSSKKDSLYYPSSVDSLESFYTNAADANLLIYNGIEYIPSPWSSAGGPFLETGDLDEGSVFYDGKLYRHVRLQYDLSKDELVAYYLKDNLAVILVSPKVKYFKLGQQVFIYFPGTENNSAGMSPGFYELLFNSKITLLVKKERQFKLSLNPNENTSSYLQRNYFYVQKDNIYYAIKDQRELLDLLKDKKDLLKKYTRDNHISFKKNPESALLQLTAYYSQLKN